MSSKDFVQGMLAYLAVTGSYKPMFVCETGDVTTFIIVGRKGAGIESTQYFIDQDEEVLENEKSIAAIEKFVEAFPEAMFTTFERLPLCICWESHSSPIPASLQNFRKKTDQSEIRVLAPSHDSNGVPASVRSQSSAS